LHYPAARFDGKECLPLRGWRCSKAIPALVPALGFEILPIVYLLYTIFNPGYILVSYQPKISFEPVPRPI